jgi:methyltransferase (TIGR00027 family)
VSKRIDKKISRTAQMVCFLRALSYYEEDESYKSNDYMAFNFLPFLLKVVLKIKFLRERVKKKLSDSGMYEYIIGRTKVIDNVFKRYSKNVDQVLILGAGFDSRGVRFRSILKDTKIFELDSAQTQQLKIKKINKNKVSVPKHLKLIPIDFEKDSLPEILDRNNFKKNKSSLVLLEGLTMFLDPKAIDSLFKDISHHCGKGSIIVFDYLYDSVLNNEMNHGEEVTKTVSSLGEEYKFGIQKGSIEKFASKYGFELVDEFNADKLKNKFFSNRKSDNNKPIDLYAIVTAKKLS